MRKDLFMALTLATLLSGHATAIADELTGTLAKVKELGYITIGHREASAPFSYLDDKRQPVGFAIDICAKIVDAVKRELKLDKLEVRYQLVTASTRIPLLANGTIDLECGSTTNNAERQQQVWYTNAHFLTASRFVSKVESKIGSISDLKGKTIVSLAGSTNIKQALEFNSRLNLGMRIIRLRIKPKRPYGRDRQGSGLCPGRYRARGPDCQRQGSKGLRDLGGRVLQA